MAKRILAADDSASMRQVVSFTLKQAGYEVVTANDGNDGARKLDTDGPFDLVLTDLNMPGMDGIGLIKAVRAHPRHRFTPVVMVTTESAAAKKAEGKAAGATGWIVKPFQPEQLLAVVAKLIGK
ncbi:response regulator [Deferrisoma sp.]